MPCTARRSVASVRQLPPGGTAGGWQHAGSPGCKEVLWWPHACPPKGRGVCLRAYPGVLTETVRRRKGQGAVCARMLIIRKFFLWCFSNVFDCLDLPLGFSCPLFVYSPSQPISLPVSLELFLLVLQKTFSFFFFPPVSLYSHFYSINH